MASDVFFVSFKTRSWKHNKINRIQELFDKAGFAGFLKKKDLTAVKLHFGERGNDSFINPVYVRQVVDKIKEAKAKPFITDTNTLYSGSRANAIDHYITAIEHGFAYAVVGAPLIIADGLTSKSIAEVEIDKKHFKSVKIASDIVCADAIIALSHFKGHELAGWGGAIKNLAMGCAPAAGKQQQHDLTMKVDKDKCTGCGSCEDVCPVGAAKLEDEISIIDAKVCIGCGECMTVCPEKAINPDWATDIGAFMERMTEYAYGAVKDKLGKMGFINFVQNVTPDCDCVPWSDSPIVPDVGILASTDPVALDKASLDLVNDQIGHQHDLLKGNHDPGLDKFQGMRSYTKGNVQVSYGEEIGLGTQEYNLIKLD
ncbi:DUF362 domain-containing protein [Desulfatibacillum aliphaticivorans]|uniref:DUF362 domain-containing protein n=1 Tax=Desulfatibacillum aliphaticivorans TaxID=218208 RepID=UPI00041F9493|nr:DUF362 domain-containing protein [Desulfatibacillum aliphaticivorans]